MYRAMRIREELPEFQKIGLYVGYVFNLTRDKTDKCYYAVFGYQPSHKIKFIEADGVTFTDAGKACDGHAYETARDSWMVASNIDAKGKILLELKKTKADIIINIVSKKQALENFIVQQEKSVKMNEQQIESYQQGITSYEQKIANNKALKARARALMQTEVADEN